MLKPNPLVQPTRPPDGQTDTRRSSPTSASPSPPPRSAPRFRGRNWPPIGRTVLALALGGALLGVGGWWWATEPPPGVSRELAGLVRDLERRPSALQRLATAGAKALHPKAVDVLPNFLQTDSVEETRLRACHRLIGLGAASRPAIPLLVQAFADRDPTVQFYAFLAIVHSGIDPSEIARAARVAWGSGSGPAFFYAGLLATEDERLRGFAWQCLEAAGDDARAVTRQLTQLAQEGDPEVRARALELLRRLGVELTAASASSG